MARGVASYHPSTLFNPFPSGEGETGLADEYVSCNPPIGAMLLRDDANVGSSTLGNPPGSLDSEAIWVAAAQMVGGSIFNSGLHVQVSFSKRQNPKQLLTAVSLECECVCRSL